MFLVLLGPPGSGKSTQGERLSALLGIPHISSGDLFRALEQADTPLARRIREYVDRGTYVPDELTNELVLGRLDRPDAERGFILDGYPRTCDQAEALDQALAMKGRGVDVILDIEVPVEVVLARLAHRRAVESRVDDTPETIRTRLEAYRKQTELVVEYYREQGKLVEIDGAQSIPDVNRAVDRALQLSPA
jgi:adenylate kinase